MRKFTDTYWFDQWKGIVCGQYFPSIRCEVYSRFSLIVHRCWRTELPYNYSMNFEEANALSTSDQHHLDNRVPLPLTMGLDLAKWSCNRPPRALHYEMDRDNSIEFGWWNLICHTNSSWHSAFHRPTLCMKIQYCPRMREPDNACKKLLSNRYHWWSRFSCLRRSLNPLWRFATHHNAKQNNPN